MFRIEFLSNGKEWTKSSVLFPTWDEAARAGEQLFNEQGTLSRIVFTWRA